jgi:hypothetical protein
MGSLARLLLSILPHLPALEEELVAEYNAIAHGEGGAAKVAKVAQGAAVLLGTIGASAVVAAAPPASQG